VIHPTAIIEPGARLAPDVAVGAYSLIGPQVELGEGCRVGPHVVIEGRTRIGRNNRISQFASIGGPPQDKKYAGEDTAVEIGDGNTIREYVTINRGTIGDARVTRVGDDNWIMAYVHFAHDCQIGSHTIFANACELAGHVQVGDWAILGATTLVHQFVQIGAHSFTGMGTYLDRDLPPYVRAGRQHGATLWHQQRGLAAARPAGGEHRRAEARLQDHLPQRARPGGSAARARSAVRGLPGSEAHPRFPERLEARLHTLVAADPVHVGMVAAEASGDLLAAHLIAALKARRPQLRFSGIGGPKMIAQGFESDVPMDRLGVRGYAEVLRHYRGIMAVRRKLAGAPAAGAPGRFHRRRFLGFQSRAGAQAEGRRDSRDPVRQPVHLGLARLAPAPHRALGHASARALSVRAGPVRKGRACRSPMSATRLRMKFRWIRTSPRRASSCACRPGRRCSRCCRAAAARSCITWRIFSC
jgi:UDP-N-acetylglucosamine acyltransferase